MNLVYGALGSPRASFLPPLVRLLGASLLCLVAACGGAATADAPSSPDVPMMYSLEHCGIYTGRDATLSLTCADGYYASAVHCDAVGGTVVRRSHGGGLYWECEGFWTDPAAGGTLCEYMTCSHVTSSEGL